MNTMKNIYYTLYKLDGFSNKDYTEVNNYFEKIIFVFQDENKLFNFQVVTQLQLQEFFIVKCKKLLYFVFVGNAILIDSWNTEIKNRLRIYIEKNVDTNSIYDFPLQDFTYLAKDKTTKPRRLRSVGGALRRILEDIRKLYWQEDTILTEVKFYAIMGNNEKLKATFVAVKSNKKIPKLEQINIQLLSKKQTNVYEKLSKPNMRNKHFTENYLYNIIHAVSETNADKKKLEKINNHLDQINKILLKS